MILLPHRALAPLRHRTGEETEPAVADGRRRSWGSVGKTGRWDQSLTGGVGPSMAPLSPGWRGAPACPPGTACLQHAGGVRRALLQLLPGFVVVVVVVRVG